MDLSPWKFKKLMDHQWLASWPITWWSKHIFGRILNIPTYTITVETPLTTIQLTLVVVDFGIKYVKKGHKAPTKCPQRSLQSGCWLYWGLYCGITLKWNYNNRYTGKKGTPKIWNLKRPIYPAPAKEYEKSTQVSIPEDTTKELSKDKKKCV